VEIPSVDRLLPDRKVVWILRIKVLKGRCKILRRLPPHREVWRARELVVGMVWLRGYDVEQLLHQLLFWECFMQSTLAVDIGIAFFSSFSFLIGQDILIDEVGAWKNEQRQLFQVACKVSTKLFGRNLCDLLLRETSLPENAWIVTEGTIRSGEMRDWSSKPSGDIVELVVSHMVSVGSLKMALYGSHVRESGLAQAARPIPSVSLHLVRPPLPPRLEEELATIFGKTGIRRQVRVHMPPRNGARCQQTQSLASQSRPHGDKKEVVAYCQACLPEISTMLQQ
jgi:hypothetical protein